MSQSKSTVSVIIPTYNRSQLLAEAIRSVLNQTYHDLEIIVVDDNSTDDTEKVIAQIRDPRLLYIRHEINKGGSAARNTGICAATGKFIAFLDDDDEWEPEKTALQLKVLEHYDVVLCASNEHLSGLARYSDKSEINMEELRQGKFTSGGTGVLMARSAVLKSAMFDEGLPRCQDWDIFIRIAQCHAIGYLNMPLVRYNEGAHRRISNAILNKPAVEIEKTLRILDKHHQFFGSRWVRWHLAGFLLYGIKHRDNKVRYLLYVMCRCGVWAVLRALGRRLYQKSIVTV